MMNTDNELDNVIPLNAQDIVAAAQQRNPRPPEPETMDELAANVAELVIATRELLLLLDTSRLSQPQLRAVIRAHIALKLFTPHPH